MTGGHHPPRGALHLRGGAQSPRESTAAPHTRCRSPTGRGARRQQQSWTQRRGRNAGPNPADSTTQEEQRGTRKPHRNNEVPTLATRHPHTRPQRRHHTLSALRLPHGLRTQSATKQRRTRSHPRRQVRRPTHQRQRTRHLPPLQPGTRRRNPIRTSQTHEASDHHHRLRMVTRAHHGQRAKRKLDHGLTGGANHFTNRGECPPPPRIPAPVGIAPYPPGSDMASKWLGPAQTVKGPPRERFGASGAELTAGSVEWRR